MGLSADGVLAVGIKNHQISITAHGDRALARVQAEKLRGSRANEFHEAVHAESSRCDAARVNQAHAVLNSGSAVGDFCEIVSPQFLLLLEAERTVVG